MMEKFLDHKILANLFSQRTQLASVDQKVLKLKRDQCFPNIIKELWLSLKWLDSYIARLTLVLMMTAVEELHQLAQCLEAEE